MRYSWRQTLANVLGPTFHGMTLRTWFELLSDEDMEIDFPYWRHFVPTTLKCLLNTSLAKIETIRFERSVQNTQVHPPIFIIGHWRSGTTFLHNLLTLDKSYAFPNLYQTLNPLTFLTTEESVITKMFSILVPRKRFIDNTEFHLGIPHEEEFAAWHASGLTSYMTWSFPRAAQRFDKYLTFRNACEDDLGKWKSDLVYFLKKLTYKYNLPLILKSPQNTCRIKLLLELFPEAKFIHIYRNPYAVFQSMKKLNQFMLKTFSFQRSDLRVFEERAIRQYSEMFEVFFEEKDLIQDGSYTEVRFEDLEKDAVREVEIIYRNLDLPHFQSVKPALVNYVKTLSSYKKNEYPDLEVHSRKKIRKEWERNFEEYGYEA